MHKQNHRKPKKLKEFSSYNSETFILCRVLPTLAFILEQAVTNTLPSVSSVCSGLQFLRSGTSVEKVPAVKSEEVLLELV